MFDLTEKVALISGASRGIGAAIAQTLAEFGAEVILTSRRIENLKEVESQIKESGKKASCIACHNGELEEIEGLFEKIRQTHGSLDILVNNAATNPYYGPVVDAEEKSWDKTLSVNLKGSNCQCFINQWKNSDALPGHLFHHQGRIDCYDAVIR